MTRTRTGVLLFTPLLALALSLGMQSAGFDPAVAWTAAITFLTAAWWVTEALPIPATSLLPFVLFPAFGILDAAEAATGLGANVIILLMGAFMLSKAIERSGLHHRFAVMMVRTLGGTSGEFAQWRLVAAFMATAALMSMWMSNSATTLMLTPIALAALQTGATQARLAVALMLGIAYAASVGGTATLVGTPPNIIFAGVYEEITGSEFSFLRWMKTGVPVALIAVPLMALWLGRGLGEKQAFDVPELGEWTAAERRVLYVFGLAIALWITRSDPFGGWSSWLGMPETSDATVALFAVVLMFLVPDKKGGALLDWETAGDIPWGLLLLFAGGIVIAKAFTASGLSVLIGDGLGGLASLPLWLMLVSLCLAVTFLTELTSNTATATLLMPVLGAAALGAGIAPELLMMPAAISASCAFMLPVATAPNAIVYGTQQVTMQQMAREGLVLNLIVAVVVAGVCLITLG